MTPPSLTIEIGNNFPPTSQTRAFVTITGLCANPSTSTGGLVPCLLLADGNTVYIPPPPIQGPNDPPVTIMQNCAIDLGMPGSGLVTITVPHLVSARIYVSEKHPLVFKLNKDPDGKVGLVAPALTNDSDENLKTTWAFMEFTLDDAEAFINLSYVDLVSVPIQFTLTGVDSNGGSRSQSVLGMPSTGLNTIIAALNNKSTEAQPWNSLIQHGSTGLPIRVMSPNQKIRSPAYSGFLDTYFDGYINQVWNHYRTHTLSIDTQSIYGVVTGTTTAANGVLTFAVTQGPHSGESVSFAQPTSRDIWSNSTGPFVTDPDSSPPTLKNTIIPRLCAGFNRGTIMNSGDILPAVDQTKYYTNEPCNLYSSYCHQANIDHRGYGFPYDDVTPNTGTDFAGAAADSNPTRLTILVGGNTRMSMSTAVQVDKPFEEAQPRLPA
jgi:hypothetical protein